MTDNSPKAVYMRMIDAYNDGTPDSYGSDRFLDFFSEDAVIEFPAMAGSPPQRGGKEVFRGALAGANGAFRNRHSVLQEVAVDGDRVIGRLHYTAGAAIDTPDWKAGTTIHNDYVDFCTVRDAAITEYTAVIGPMLPETTQELRMETAHD